MDKVSIIIPVWNRIENTSKLLDTLIEQKARHPQTEIICIENGSTIDMSFLYKYKDIILRHEDVAGVYHAYNTAFKIAKGNYICFIDNDDWIPDYYLDVIYNNIRTGKDWYVWKWYSDDTPVTMDGVDLKCPLKLNWAMWGYCISAKLFDGIVFDESVPTGDDVRVMKQIITEETDGAFIDEFMYRFKWAGNDDSISHIYNRTHEPIHL